MSAVDSSLTTRCQLAPRSLGPIVSRIALPGSNIADVSAKETLNDRVWYAFHCLQRVRGKPPAATAVEAQHDISRGTLSRLFKGDRKTVDNETLAKLATALNVTTDWLSRGIGERPKLTGAIRPRDERYEELDPSTWVEKSIAAGGLTIPTNNFQAAVATLFNELSVETIRAVAAEAVGHENERPAHHWGARLHEVERASRSASRSDDEAPKKRATTKKRDEPRRKAS